MKKSYKLPNMEFKFHIQTIGEETGINWVGDFTYRRPTLQERALIDVMRARLNGDLLTVDGDISSFNEALAHLRFTLKEYPPWWEDCDFGGALFDANVILDIREKCIEFEAEWKTKTLSGVAKEVEAGNEKIADKSPAGVNP